MSLGLRKYIVAFVETRLHRLFPILLLIALCYPFALPLIFARRNFFDENALMQGQAESVITSRDSNFAFHNSTSPKVLLQQTVAQCSRISLRVLDGEVDTQYLLSLHAPRSNGREAILLHTFWDRADGTLPIALKVLEEYAKAVWLTYDLVLAVTNAGPGQGMGILQALETDGVKLRAAVVVDLGAEVSLPVVVDTIGFMGQQPNMDFANLALTMAEESGIPATFIDDSVTMMPSFLPDIFTELQYYNLRFYASYLRQLIQPISFRSYVHAEYRQADVQAVTYRSRSGNPPSPTRPIRRVAPQLAKMLDLTLRSLNNLNERLHHSFVVWFPISNVGFVDDAKSQIQGFLLIAVLFCNAGMARQEWTSKSLVCITFTYLSIVFFAYVDPTFLVATMLCALLAVRLPCFPPRSLLVSKDHRPVVLVAGASAIFAYTILHPTLSLVAAMLLVWYAVVCPEDSVQPSRPMTRVIRILLYFATSPYMLLRVIGNELTEKPQGPASSSDLWVILALVVQPVFGALLLG